MYPDTVVIYTIIMIDYITTKQEGYCCGMVYFYNKHDIETEYMYNLCDEISFIIHKMLITSCLAHGLGTHGLRSLYS